MTGEGACLDGDQNLKHVRGLSIPLLDALPVPRAQQAQANFAIRVEVGVQAVAEREEEDGGRDSRIVGAAGGRGGGGSAEKMEACQVT